MEIVYPLLSQSRLIFKTETVETKSQSRSLILGVLLHLQGECNDSILNAADASPIPNFRFLDIYEPSEHIERK